MYNVFWLENKRNLHTLKEYVKFLFHSAGGWYTTDVIIPIWLVKIRYKISIYLDKLRRDLDENKVRR